MAETSDLRRGMIILFNNEPHVMIEKEFYSPGKGGAFNRCKLKSIKTGKIVANIFKSGERVNELDVSSRTVQYLYDDGTIAFFMDPISFDQFEVSLNIISGGKNFLHTEGKYIVTIYEEEVIFVQIPQKLTLEVVETPEGSKGDTVSNATKEAVLETGFKVQVPLFIKKGEKIMINTEEGKYYSKA